MQKIATRIFIITSVIFGIVGITMILTTPPGGDGKTALNIVLMKLLFTCVFIILPSFAVSLASKYLNNKS